MSRTWKFENWIAASWDRSSPGRQILLGIRRWIARERSPFQEIAIAEVPGHGRGLFLDAVVQLLELDEFVYHEHLALPPLLFHPGPRRVLIQGGGDGLALREVLRDPRVEEAVLVDIDGRVVELCREHLAALHRGSFDAPRARVVVGDVLEFLARRPEPFDVVLTDLVDAYEPDALALYERVLPATAAVLAEGGIVCQFGDLSPPAYRLTPLYCALARRFRYVALHRAWVESFGSEYGFVLASDAVDFPRVPTETIAERAARLEGRLRALVPEQFPAAFRLPPVLDEHLRRALAGDGAAEAAPVDEPAVWLFPEENGP